MSQQDQFAEYESVRRNPTTGQMIGLKNGKWIPVLSAQPTATGEAPVPPESAISRLGSGAKAGLQQLIPSNPFTVPALEKAAMGPTGMLLDAINRVRAEFAQARREGQPPWAAALAGPAAVAGIDTEGVRQRGDKGDIAGIVGESIPLVAATLLLPEIPKMGAEAVEASRGPIREVLSVGGTFEKQMAAEHQTATTDYNAKLSKIMEENRRAVDEARQTHAQAVENVQKQNGEARKTYQEKIDAIRQKYAGQVAAKESGSREASASQSAAETKRAALGDSPRSGPVFQRLQDMTNQVYGMIDNLQDRIRSEYNRRWRAFDQSIGDRKVNWTPVQQAVKDAEDNILQGSPESIAIFRNIMRESPQLDQASVFRTSQSLEAAGNLKEILRDANPNMRRQILANLHAQGLSEADVEGSAPAGEAPAGLPGKDVQIPFADARGYFTELGSKLSGAQLPGDVYRAIKHVLRAADTQIGEPVKAAGQEGTYRNLRDEYKTYKQNFDDPEAAIYQFDKLDTPEKRVDFLASGKGQNLIDSLSKYKGFGSDPNLPGRVRSLVRQLRDLPASKATPAAPERPTFPKAPELKENPAGPDFSGTKEPPDAVEPLDITRKRLEKLEQMGKNWSQFNPSQARWIRSAVMQRTIGKWLSDPAIRDWIARNGPK